MIQRLGENDELVTRYMDDPEFQNAAFPILAWRASGVQARWHADRSL